jgi:hypothetical protein
MCHAMHIDKKKETTLFSCATCLFKVSSFNDNSLSFPSIDVHIMHFTWDTKPSSPLTRFNPSKLDYSKIMKDPSLCNRTRGVTRSLVPG